MTGKKEPLDLCASCLNDSDCFYCKNKKASVHFCEEFASKSHEAHMKDIDRLKRDEALFLPDSKPGVFDDCGKPGLPGS